jgi:hypothetical protein
MHDELEANRRRTLLSEWRSVAESEREDTSRRAQAIEAERVEAEAAAAAPEEARRRAINAQAWANAMSPRHPVSAIDREEIRQRKIAREERERKEAEAVRDWVVQKNFEERRSQPVVAARAESGDDYWSAWRKFIDGRIEKFFTAHVEQLIERKVEQRMLQVYRENHEIAVSVRKSIEAIARALEGHDKLIRELGKREETGTRSSDIPQRPLRVVN